MNNSKLHWENVYETKSPEQVSWTQKIPIASLDYIDKCNINKDEPIIDIGGGDSNLVDHLVKLGYKNISVLDISAKAIERAKKRLGDNAKNVTWIVTDMNDFEPKENYTLWHDRAAFHFLTSKNEIENYISLVEKYVSKHLVLGTFSINGPKKCSGLDISQYDSELIDRLFQKTFNLDEFILQDHKTPFNTIQNFIYCKLSKK